MRLFLQRSINSLLVLVVRIGYIIREHIMSARAVHEAECIKEHGDSITSHHAAFYILPQTSGVPLYVDPAYPWPFSLPL